MERMALLLLDNASEVLMYRAIVNALEHYDLFSRLFSYARTGMPDDVFNRKWAVRLGRN